MSVFRWTLLGASVALLAVMWWVLKPEAPAESSSQTHQFSFELHPAQPPSARTLSVYQGDQVHLHAHSPQMAHLHLHKYDLHLYLAPDYPSQVAFVADQVGRFELEWHEGRQRLATLEVYPRP